MLCSPAAAKSRWVDEEVRTFKQLGREDRVLAVIVKGEPHAQDPAEECFPPAVRFKLSAAGELLEQVSEPIAADMRPQGDGKDDSKLKLIAGVLGISLNDLRRRELVAARKRARVSQAIAAVMLLLAVLAVGGGWIAYQNQQKAERRFDMAMNIAAGVVDRAVAMSDKYGVPGRAIVELLDWAGQAFGALSAEGLPDRLKYQQANKLMVFSDQYARQNSASDQLRVAREARDILAPLVANRPENEDWRQRLSMVYDRIGKAHLARGNLGDALAAHYEALAST